MPPIHLPQRLPCPFPAKPVDGSFREPLVPLRELLTHVAFQLQRLGGGRLLIGQERLAPLAHDFGRFAMEFVVVCSSRFCITMQNSLRVTQSIEPKHVSLTFLQMMALILFLYGVLVKDGVWIWVSIGLALAQETQPTIKNFLMLVKEKVFPDNSKKPEND